MRKVSFKTSSSHIHVKTEKQKKKKTYNKSILKKSHLILLNIEPPMYSTQLSKKVNMQYPYVTKVLNKMKQANLITTTQNGRTKMITLTPKGQQFQYHLQQIKELIQYDHNTAKNKRNKTTTQNQN